MLSKKKDAAKPNIFPVLFMTVEGEPMSFYLRPGPVKRKLQPLITAGGGLLCSVQQPGAILLIDPEEKGSIPESTAHWYVSTQYILDCIKKEEQLDLEDYRLNPDVVQMQSPRLSNRKDISPPGLGGRVAYTPEEDAAILSYVSKHKTEVGGNRLWQQMEKQHVTSHSWQSMKYHYKVRLANKQSEIEEVETTEEEVTAAKEETKEEKDQETEDAAPPQTHAETKNPLQTHSAETDLTQIDAKPTSAESTQPENSTEAEASSSPQPEEPHVDLQLEAVSAESTEPETDASQTTISPQKENVPEDSQPVQPEPLPSASSSKKLKEKEKDSPKSVQSQRRSLRRQLEVDETPYNKKLRSASGEQPPSSSSSPKPSNKTKSAVKSASKKDTTADEPPPKRTRRKTGSTEEESQQEESVQPTVSETVQADHDSAPQTGGKKKEKRKLGILELATKEFEDESEPEDEAPHLQNPAETVALQPTSIDPLPPSSDTAADAASTQSNLESGPGDGGQDKAQASATNHLPETNCPQPAATKPAASEPAAAQPAATKPAAAQPAAAEEVQATSKAHLFIFDNESQEEESQSVLSHSTSVKPQPAVNKEAALSLTQVQLEEDKQRIRELISQTKQDLVCVTKALLRTSGDFSAALDLLLNPSSSSGPFWNHCDDGLLLSADPAARQQLQEKYSEEGVAKRIVFLEIDG